MSAPTPTDTRIAKTLICGVAGIFAARWGIWAAFTDQPWYVRAVVGAIAGGFLFAAVPALLKWIGETGVDR